MTTELNPANWNGAVTWQPNTSYAVNTLVVYQPVGASPGFANVYQCIAQVSSAVTPDQDPSHWSLLVALLPTTLLSSDTFLRFRLAFNNLVLAAQDMSYRQLGDETDIQNLLTNNLGGYQAPRNGLQTRLNNDEAAIVTLQTMGLVVNKGTWAPTTQYRKGDGVIVDSFGSIYTAATDHTSGSDFSTDLAAGKWTLFVSLVGAVLNYTIQTASFTAQPGCAYFVDCSAGPVNISLPANPTISTPPITITHVNGDVTVNAVTLLHNGNAIMGVVDDLQIDKNNTSTRLVFCNASLGWRLTIL